MKATLEDLKMELWLRQRNSGEMVWVTKDRSHIPIKDMSDSHLHNLIKMWEEGRLTHIVIKPGEIRPDIYEEE